MTIVSLDVATAEKFSLPKSFSWRDSHINCTLAVAQPSTDPDACMFFVVLDDAGRLAGQESAALRR